MVYNYNKESGSFRWIKTIPEASRWNKLHSSIRSNHSLVIVKIQAQAVYNPNLTEGPATYHLNLTNYYDYCKISDINILGHTLDLIDWRYKCRINFYFASIKDKAHFVLKFE